MSDFPLCQLCSDCGRMVEADVFVTIPMCGERPRYPLCLACMDDVADYAEDIEPIEVGA